ncbi:hypothetical protein G6F50_017755 [Rhizopus delemar]|uniref:N-acetyltransferase domain-containing protein n=1 Tax=Rhizopus delemar TaxID=936053 RepID=A0A9P6XPJ5_9FUNG|nr:hypothetical protein G6F50_017755 [Rhizopus delemar]
MVITHTEVPEPIAGRGIAGELTRVALRFAREQKYKVVPAWDPDEDSKHPASARQRAGRRGGRAVAGRLPA